jgi:hypothetical protein
MYLWQDNQQGHQRAKQVTGAMSGKQEEAPGQILEMEEEASS